MTGLEIAIIGGVVGFIIVGVGCLTGMALEKYLKSLRRQRAGFEIVDVTLTASRPVVLVGQASDIRFGFTVKNPRGWQLNYSGQVTVQEIANVQPQQNTFAHQHFRTEVPRLACSWSSVGTKRVAAFVTVQGRGKAATALIETTVEVVAELPQ